jgi:hypothetical protein
MPREDVDIAIAGSAVVRLQYSLTRIHPHGSGSGQIKQVP